MHVVLWTREEDSNRRMKDAFNEVSVKNVSVVHIKMLGLIRSFCGTRRGVTSLGTPHAGG